MKNFKKSIQILFTISTFLLTKLLNCNFNKCEDRLKTMFNNQKDIKVVQGYRKNYCILKSDRYFDPYYYSAKDKKRLKVI